MKWSQLIKGEKSGSIRGLGQAVVLFGTAAVGLLWVALNRNENSIQATPEMAIVRPQLDDPTPEITPSSQDSANEDQLATRSEAALPGATVTNVTPSVAASPPTLPIDSPRVGRAAIDGNLALLQRGIAFLQQSGGYTAQFTMQEVVSGRLQAPVEMLVKVRHQPFSVYMNWKTSDPGKETIYVAGKNDGRVVAHFGGWKGKVLPTLRVDPQGSLAMSYSRYPITEFGLLALHERLLADRKADVDRGLTGMNCLIEPGSDETGRLVYYFEIEYDNPSVSPLYRRSEQMFDRETAVLLRIDNFTWSNEPTAHSDELRSKTLIESYHYEDLEFSPEFADVDFHETNPNYQFKQ